MGAQTFWGERCFVKLFLSFKIFLLLEVSYSILFCLLAELEVLLLLAE